MTLSRSLLALLRSNDRAFSDLLARQAHLAVQCLRTLHAHDQSHVDDLRELIKQIEREGDQTRRVLIQKLVGTYATPWDREDLFALSRAIDDILDAANETAIELAVYDIALPATLREMLGVLMEGTEYIHSAVQDLLDHPVQATEYAVRAKRTENRLDYLYHEAINQLFDDVPSLPTALKLREVYRHLKNSADRVDRAADLISVIIIKGT